MREAYVQRDNRAFEAHLEGRTASTAAAFFLPHLRSGMRVLDVGCGPGTITLGLAEAVAPGEIVGIDIQPAMVQRARELAAARGIANVRFEVADAYELPFGEASFDAAFAHMVLMHLTDPVRALRAIRNVLRPDGFIGARDPDLATTVRYPSSAPWERFIDLRMRAHDRQGSDGRVARKHRQVLLAAGFARSESRPGTFGGGGGTADAPSRVSWLKAQLDGIARVAIAEKWLDQAGVDAIAADIDEWARQPDAMFFTVFCETLGWVRA